MNTSLRMSDIEKWYDDSSVKFEIIKSTMKREMACLVPSWCDSDMRKNSIRMLKCHSVQHLDYILKKGLRVWERRILYNLYYSLGRYHNGIPDQTFNMTERDNSEWNANHLNVMMGYDCLIDIDAGDVDDILDAHYTCLRIIDLFNAYNVPYEVRFSGMGFHVIIPYVYFSHLNKSVFPSDDDNIYSLYAEIARFLSKTISEMIDLHIYDSRRVCKIPFSLALYEGHIFVCYPFDTLDSIQSFHLADFELMNFNKNIRGQAGYVFNHEGSVNELIEVVKNGKKKKA